jgi:F0F1-type ATP synthase membrane subunit b/b'
MIENMLWACAFVLACILFYRFAIPALKRFDDENVRRIAVQETETADPQAHFRHALDVANEQIEAVQEVRAGAVTQYLFETEIYFTREEAEEARAERVGVIARRFYQELPAALAGARTRGKMSARERASEKWRGRNGETMH